MKTRWLPVALLVSFVLSVSGVSVAQEAQSPEAKAVTEAIKKALAEQQNKEESIVLLGMAKEWSTWPLIDEMAPEMLTKTAEGKDVVLGRAEGRHTEMPYGHVDVVMVYSFGAKEYSFARVEVGGVVRFVFRAEDGTLFVPVSLSIDLKLDAGGQLESYTISYELRDGTKGKRTFSRLIKS